MWPFSRKVEAKPAPKQELPPIEFRADDDMMKRAENIWYALGFANDRHRAIPALAGYLSMYRDWDNTVRDAGEE